MKWSMTVKPYRLAGAKKDMTMAWGIDADSAAEAVAYVADRIAEQPERTSLQIVVERTDR